MKYVLLGMLVLAIVGLGALWSVDRRRRTARALADAREDALRWYERLGGQIMNLSGDQLPVRQALVDAGERYNAAGGQLERATTTRQYQLARETALEGLQYARAARIALGFDAGPDLPPLAGQRAAGAITKDRQVDVQGHEYRASPYPRSATPYYYPGGTVAGRRVPSGWYSEPWWKTALVAGAWGLGSVLLFDALFSPAWGDSGYDAGFQEGVAAGDLSGGADEAAGGAAGDVQEGFGEAGDFGGEGGYSGGGDWGGGGAY